MPTGSAEELQLKIGLLLLVGELVVGVPGTVGAAVSIMTDVVEE
jgi:hypothetical protein